MSYFTATGSVILNEDLCYSANDRGTTYNGKVNVTRFYERCLSWAEVSHCEYNPFNAPGKDSGLSNVILEGNFCRNPDYKTGILPWCYIEARRCLRNYCDPCLYGTRFDRSKTCEKDVDAGICSLPQRYASECAKSCEDNH